MSEPESFDVIISGGGPVGLITACLLDKYDLSVAVFDSKTHIRNLPKAFHASQSSMEIFAKIGIYEEILRNSTTKDINTVMEVSTGMMDSPFIKLKFDKREIFDQDFKNAMYVMQNGEISQAESVFISQCKLEQLFQEFARDSTKIQLFYGYQISNFYENGSGVIVEAKSTTRDESLRIFQSDYLIGCDGGKSTVRKKLGVQMYGEIGLQRFLMIYIESEDLIRRFENRSSRFGISTILNNERIIVAFHVEEDENIILQVSGGPNKDISDITKLDRSDLVQSILGKNTQFRIIDSTVWTASQLIATHFQKGRVFLAGDAAHLWIPAGGLGMNTGLQDSLNLSWKIAAMCQGWSGPYLAASYQLEQKCFDYNVLRMVSQGTERIVLGRIPIWLKFSTYLIRVLNYIFERRIAKAFLNNAKYFALQYMGQRFVTSNICIFEEDYKDRLELAPDPDSHQIRDIPGCRAPHITLSSGTPIRHGDYTRFLLLSFVEEANFKIFLEQASTRSVPVELIIQKKEVNSPYHKNFYLIRPDGFISWRSDSLPNGREVSDVLDRVVGWAKPERINPAYVDWTWKSLPNIKKELCILFPLLACSIWILSLPFIVLPFLLLLYGGVVVYRILKPMEIPRKQVVTRHRAAVCNTPGAPQEVVNIISDHVCEIEPNDIIVNVKYGTLHNIDYKLCRGYASNLLNFVFSLSSMKRFPLVLGRDFAGEIVVVGSSITDFVPGDKVFGCRDISSPGTLSEFISVKPSEICLMPECLSYDQAASLPYAYLSAASGLSELPKDSIQDQTVLLCDMGTTTGLILTQVLVNRGARVHVWCHAEFEAKYLNAGALEVSLLREKLQDVKLSDYSIVFDINSGISDFTPEELGSLEKGSRLICWSRPGARMIEQYGPVFGAINSILSIRSKRVGLKRKGILLSYVKLRVESDVLRELSSMIETGSVKPLKGEIFPLSDTAKGLSSFEDPDWIGPAIIQVT